MLSLNQYLQTEEVLKSIYALERSTNELISTRAQIESKKLKRNEMFKRIFLFYIACTALSSQANTSSFKFTNLKKNEFAKFDGKSYKTFFTYESNGLKLSKSCEVKTGTPTCAAFLAAKAPLPIEGSPFNGSPSSQLCQEVKGTNIIAFDNLKKEYNFCEFEDGSLVNSWSLFYLRYPKKSIK